MTPPLNQQPQQDDDEMLLPHTEFPHGPQPLEVAQAETANMVDAQPVDDPPSARFTWTIDNFSRLNIKKLYSDVFYVGGYKWRILIFPKGNNVDHLSMYLDVADSATLPYAWSRYAQFSLSVINQVPSKYSVRKETQHQFNARESDWGFTTFMPLGELYDPAKGYLVNDTCIVEADVAVLSYEGQQGKQELKRKEECFYTVLKVARNEDLTEQIGRDIYFDLVNHDKVRHFRIPKQMPFYQFKEKVANEFGIPVQFQRFWMWAKRQNHTYRPLRPLTSFEELQPVGQLREISDKKNEKELKLFLEVELDSDLRSIAPPEKTKEDILLFCKLYDPQKEELRYVGRLFAKLSGKPNGILTKLNQMAGFSPNQEIELFEEIKFEPCVMCEPIAKEATFRASQIGDGDIICFQKSQAGNEQSRYPDVPSFLENLPKRKGAYVKAQQEPKHIESQTIIHDAPHELPPSPGNLTQEQSTQVAVDLTVIEQNERGAHEAKTTPFPSVSHVVDPTSVHPHQEPNLVETAIGSSSFASFDALFADIQSLLEVETFEAASWSIDEIADAKKIVKQCLDMKLACFIQSGRTSEFKKSVSAMLTVNAFPDSMVDVITKFLDDFDQSCERYVGAEKDLREVEQKEKSIVELKTTLKQLSSKFMPIRNRADEVNREIADLERQLAERKAEKAQLQSNLEELAGKATTSRQALINAEQDLRLFRHKKEEAEKTVGDIERSWKSMKDYCFLIL